MGILAPYFSVITPSWNQGAFLGGCIESVLAQADGNFEHFVFDNCSTDETSRVAARYPHVVFSSEPDRGQSHAVNKGFAAARGEIICWLNADDTYPSGLFAKLRRLFADPAVRVVFGAVEQVSYDGRRPQRVDAVFRDRLDLVRWWTSRARLHQPAVFFRRACAATAGPLREDLHYAMDYEYWWRLSEKNPFFPVPEVLAIQHRQPESKTMRAWHKVLEEREKIFSPHYGLVDGGDRASLMGEKCRELGRRYLLNASASAATDPRAALADLRRAFAENPRSLFDPAWLGVVRRCLGV
jgi:glycosyltransferase involved in cell wall biosynthesis